MIMFCVIKAEMLTKVEQTKDSAIAERSRDAHCRWKFC